MMTERRIRALRTLAAEDIRRAYGGCAPSSGTPGKPHTIREHRPKRAPAHHDFFAMFGLGRFHRVITSPVTA